MSTIISFVIKIKIRYTERMKRRLKKNQLTKFISLRFRADKFDRLEHISVQENISRPELIRKVLLDYIDEWDLRS
jgi:hypothetical protein